MDREYLLLDIAPAQGDPHYFWSGDVAARYNAAMTEGVANYLPIDMVNIEPASRALDNREPAVRLQIGLDDTEDTPQGNAYRALRDGLSRPVVAVRIIVGLGSPPVVAPAFSFLGQVRQNSLRDGLWTIEAEHFFGAILEQSPPAPQMGDEAHRLAYEGDLGFSHMQQTHHFLASWPQD